MKKHHTLLALVENQAGVLNRIASLFRRRRFNIESLTVGVCEKPGLSRMTIVVDGETTNVDQVLRQMGKLINVIEVKDVTGAGAVIRELALIKVQATPKTETEILKIANMFHAKIIQEKAQAFLFELVGAPDKIEACLELWQPLGIAELCRTGVTAMAGIEE
jgi:acetolactate synthase-1/3 small subunit